MKNKWLLALGIVVFGAFFIASIVQESPMLLYIASAIPIFIVPFLPDFKTNQRLRSQRKGVNIVKLTGKTGEPEWLVVSFKPGTVYWNRKKLIISYKEAPTVQTVDADDYTAALTVLNYDMSIRRKPGRIDVSLPNLSQRITGMPFTVHEVNRLVIALADFTESEPTNAPPPVASRNVELHA
ncbi:hypothetical protein ACFFNY_05075 [Paenibacillus hodogayensis]|uniref:Uncharacterized protein n=1 Tax=Paenibacillus hodogayensis TaxID=279208 RepID=A0ABV5VRP8_9BACL